MGGCQRGNDNRTKSFRESYRGILENDEKFIASCQWNNLVVLV